MASNLKPAPSCDCCDTVEVPLKFFPAEACRQNGLSKKETTVWLCDICANTVASQDWVCGRYYGDKAQWFAVLLVQLTWLIIKEVRFAREN